jgi:hypothetical protein
VLFDAVFVPGGAESARTLADDRDAIESITDAFRHCKAIGAIGEGAQLLRLVPGAMDAAGMETEARARRPRRGRSRERRGPGARPGGASERWPASCASSSRRSPRIATGSGCARTG